MYLITLALWAVAIIVNLLVDIVTGAPQQSLSIEDFELHDLVVADTETLYVTGNDPQMIYTKDGIESIYYRLAEPASGVVCAYYLYDTAQDFSNQKRLFPNFGESQEVLYVFPHGIEGIRLDIGSIQGEIYQFEEIVLNGSVSIQERIVPTNRQLALMIFMPIIAYSVVTMFFMRRGNE